MNWLRKMIFQGCRLFVAKKGKSRCFLNLIFQDTCKIHHIKHLFYQCSLYQFIGNLNRQKTESTAWKILNRYSMKLSKVKKIKRKAEVKTNRMKIPMSLWTISFNDSIPIAKRFT